MRSPFRVAPIVLGVLTCLCTSVECRAQEDLVKVYKAEAHVSPPQLLPIDLSASIAPSCDEHQSAKIQIAMIVDRNGKPRDLMMSRPLGDTRDEMAIEIASRDHFSPGELDRVPVAVSITLDIILNSCIVQVQTADGGKIGKYRLLSQPEQKVGPASQWEPEKLEFSSNESPAALAPYRIGGPVKPPIPIITPEAAFSDEARKKGIQGVCIIQVLVDQRGFPQNIRMVKPLGYGLDAAAMEAVKRYRFKPAMLDGFRPVPVSLAVEVNFRLGGRNMSFPKALP